MYKFLVLASVLAYANAGLLAAPGYATAYAAPAYATGYAAAPALAYGHAAVAPAAITSQSSNIYRGFGNLGQVSTYSKTIDTPYSSVRKADIRVSNPGIATAVHASPLAYAAAPAYATHAYAPAAYAAPAVAAHGPLLGVAYSAAPAVSHINFDGLGVHYGW